MRGTAAGTARWQSQASRSVVGTGTCSSIHGTPPCTVPLVASATRASVPWVVPPPPLKEGGHLTEMTAMTTKKHNGEDDHGDENEPTRRRDEGEEQAPWLRARGASGERRATPLGGLENPPGARNPTWRLKNLIPILSQITAENHIPRKIRPSL